MTRINFSEKPCSFAQCLSAVGDIWSFLIVRDAMSGLSRYSEFEKSLGVAKNILRNRLNKLVSSGIFEKMQVGIHGSRFEYKLTSSGKDLFPMMVAIYQWSEKWVPEEHRSQFKIYDSFSMQPISVVEVFDKSWKPLQYDDILSLPK
ncbi:putative transcriptional regulator [Marinomonas sp. MED121]|uniref:winged helix-turn-helix transcriptional regulator n=1 Tax=Marinomonas sp. MED121 TaxID=314277 RepID=UPI000068FA12|nr:helix-turn-helix domain-containing protein [Marinomonas sp. MED121]EAQ64171.1 putative transcriptional regulator [Marinomonas sp. MED121]